MSGSLESGWQDNDELPTMCAKLSKALRAGWKEPMKIALIGYGKMGRMIERVALEQGDEIVLTLDEHNNSQFEGFSKENLGNADVAIDFSTPASVIENVSHLATAGVSVVIGTTGWTERIPEVRALAEQHQVGIVWSPNFSIGVNIFFRLVSEAARLFREQPGYEAWAYEIHHSAKLDAPSGTLLKLVEEMRSVGYTGKIDVSSNRVGAIPGTHQIGFDTPADTITLEHVARSREGFAQGALLAARWIQGNVGFFGFEEALFGPKNR